jgi:hypothetical protein
MILILFLIYQEHKQKSLYSAFASAFLLLFLCFYYICQQFNSFYNTLLIKNGYDLKPRFLTSNTNQTLH